MKLTSVELHPAGSASVCVLSFRNPAGTNPYNVKGIGGLDADDIVSRFYGGSGNSARFFNLALEARSIPIRIGLNPRFNLDESFSSLRDELYKLIASSRTGTIEVQFLNGEDVIATLTGFVTKFEAPHFEKTQEVILTIKCDDPMLRAPEATVVDVEELDPAETLIQDLLSTAPHGFTFELSFQDDMASLIIGDPDDDTWLFTVSPAGGFLEDDVLHFSSENNDKYLYLVRGMTTIHLADKILSGSVWPILFPGDNTFELTTAADVTWESISYRPAYWGV